MDELKSARVLLLEDEFLIAMDAEAILRELGAAQVETAATLADAERLASSGRFDIAMLDVNINGEMSLPLARALREDGVPVVLATGYELRDEASEAGSAWLRKPYSREGLEQALAEAFATDKTRSAAT